MHRAAIPKGPAAVRTVVQESLGQEKPARAEELTNSSSWCQHNQQGRLPSASTSLETVPGFPDDDSGTDHFGQSPGSPHILSYFFSFFSGVRTSMAKII